MSYDNGFRQAQQRYENEVPDWYDQDDEDETDDEQEEEEE
jgi:hypothetical protein